MITPTHLIEYIGQHNAKAVALPTGQLLAEENYAGDGFPDTACELYGPYWTPIEPKLSAVRDWLGY